MREQVDVTARLRGAGYRAYTKIPHGWMARRRQGGLSSVANRAIERALASGPVAVSGGLARGVLLSPLCFPPSQIQAHGLVRGTLEESVQGALAQHLSPGDVFLDVGANIGFFSILAARLVGPEGRVEAFEPLPETVAALRANLDLNDLTNVRVHEVAVAESSGRARFLRASEAGWSHLEDRGLHPGIASSIEVHTVPLDRVIEDANIRPTVVKIDVEGSEEAVLRGAEVMLSDHQPTLIIEFHETNREVVEFLRSRSYEIFNLEGEAPVVDAGAVHALAVPVRSITSRRLT